MNEFGRAAEFIPHKSTFKCVKVLPYYKDLLEVGQVVTFSEEFDSRFGNVSMISFYHKGDKKGYATSMSEDLFFDSFIPL